MSKNSRGGPPAKRADVAAQAFGRRGCNSRPVASEGLTGVGHGSSSSRIGLLGPSPFLYAGVAYI